MRVCEGAGRHFARHPPRRGRGLDAPRYLVRKKVAPTAILRSLVNNKKDSLLVVARIKIVSDMPIPLQSTPLGSVIQITYERVLECRGKRPHRINFARTQQNEPKRALEGESWVGSFSVHFEKTIRPLFRAATNLPLFPSRQSREGQEPGVWRSIHTEEEFSRIQDWVTAQGTLVFLRDCLDLSLALDYNFVDVDGSYTPVGELEHKAKTSQDANALEILSGLLIDRISGLPFFRDATKVAAVPAAKGKAYDLPRELATRVATALSKEDLTSRFAFHGEKGKVKDCRLEKKWPLLESAELRLSGSDLGGSSVILIDDKYQSGTTMQYVAMKLQIAGAKRVFGISLVKTLRDGDNVATK